MTALEEKTYAEYKIIEELMQDRAFAWAQTASPDDLQLQYRVYALESYFRDMLFENGTETYKLVQVQAKMDGSDNWIDTTIDLPDTLDCFSLSWFTYHVKELEDGADGVFNGMEYSLSVSPQYLTDDSAILHEMIHLHEFIINLHPLFFHDAIFWCLYRKLSKEIPDLDERIEAHGHILNSSIIARQGGTHDILFLLKSFDLDLQMGYQLGTVFGYGMVDQRGELDIQKPL